MNSGNMRYCTVRKS